MTAQTDTVQKATVLGGGSFGTAIANILAENGFQVGMWMRNPQTLKNINEERENKQYLPGLKLNSAITATDDIQAAISGSDVVFYAIPSKSFREIVERTTGLIEKDQILISTTKGIEPEGFNLMSDILKGVFPVNPVGVISGPNLAKEIAQGQLAATVIASKDKRVRDFIQQSLSCKFFRIYVNADMYGVELGGALKNIYAIITGMAAALGYGENTKAMLITRSLAEMSRFAVSQGANPMTFLGLAGVGDLVATCVSPLSRNYRIGYAIGKGESLEEATQALGEVAEGINTLRYVRNQANELGIYMPLVNALYAVLFEGVRVEEVAVALMTGDHNTDVEFSLPRGA
ncbi:NAD(P)H-dependent glycerol-3-phosphate dehydrogenase [Oceaniserpentilla sp. 4NH20-0058]|uniref:NAD(P)H-dependent glycerol-3-phosphate dehydrogenase n=1 Tax=Oceaniserpentilla sp. 4NH20-0058 TaxID=3127660 RepID=UPI00310B0DF4